MKRSPLPRRRKPMTRNAGLRSVSKKQQRHQRSLKERKRILWARCEGRCEVPWCREMNGLDAHHVIKRSQGGTDDLTNLVAICRKDHDATDLPFGKGRLAIAWFPSRQCFGFFLWTNDREHEQWVWGHGLTADGRERA